MYGMVTALSGNDRAIGPDSPQDPVKGTITDYPAGTTTMAAKKVTASEADGAATNVTDMSNGLSMVPSSTLATEDTVYKWRVAAIDLVNNADLKQINEGTVKTGSTTRYLWLTADTLYFDAVPTNPTSLAAGTSPRTRLSTCMSIPPTTRSLPVVKALSTAVL